MGARGKKPNTRLRENDYKFANLVLNGMGLSDAARECGYSEKSIQTAANRLLNKPAVQEYMKAERLRRAEIIRQDTEVDDIWITKKFKEILDRCMQARPVMRYDHEAGELRQARDDDSGDLLFEFDSAGAIKAAENLAKHIGYYEIDNNQKKPVIQVGCLQQNILNFFEGEDDEEQEAIDQISSGSGD